MAKQRSRNFLLVLVVIVGSVSPAVAAVRYRTCASLRTKHPEGVGRNAAVDKVKPGQIPSVTWTVDSALYRSLPKSLDPDNDAIACEIIRAAAPIQPLVANTTPPTSTPAETVPTTQTTTTAQPQTTTTQPPPTPVAPTTVTTDQPVTTVAPVATTTLRRFTNCDSLNSVYPHGVGREGASDIVRGNTKVVTNFHVDTALYNAQPKTLDRDEDGIACENP
jgi:Excalibur calcium-binding domain